MKEILDHSYWRGRSTSELIASCNDCWHHGISVWSLEAALQKATPAFKGVPKPHLYITWPVKMENFPGGCMGHNLIATFCEEGISVTDFVE